MRSTTCSSYFRLAFRNCVGSHARVILGFVAFQLFLVEAVDVKSIIGVDRVFQIVARVLVWWKKEVWMKKPMCSSETAVERANKKMRHVRYRLQILFRHTKRLCKSWAKHMRCAPRLWTDCTALYVQCLLVYWKHSVDFLGFFQRKRNHSQMM